MLAHLAREKAANDNRCRFVHTLKLLQNRHEIDRNNFIHRTKTAEQTHVSANVFRQSLAKFNVNNAEPMLAHHVREDAPTEKGCLSVHKLQLQQDRHDIDKSNQAKQTSQANQPNNHPTNQPTNQPASRPANRPAGRRTKPTGQPAGQPAGQPTN